MKQFLIPIFFLSLLYLEQIVAQTPLPPPPAEYDYEIISIPGGSTLQITDLTNTGIVLGNIVLNGKTKPFTWDKNKPVSEKLRYLLGDGNTVNCSFVEFVGTSQAVGRLNGPTDQNNLVFWDGSQVSNIEGVSTLEADVEVKYHFLTAANSGIYGGQVKTVYDRRMKLGLPEPEKIYAIRAFVGYNNNAELLPLYENTNTMLIDYNEEQSIADIQIRDNKFYVLGSSSSSWNNASNGSHTEYPVPTFWTKNKTNATWVKNNQSWTVQAFPTFESGYLKSMDKLVTNGVYYGCGLWDKDGVSRAWVWKLSSPWTNFQLVSHTGSEQTVANAMQYISTKNKTIVVGRSANKAVKWTFLSENNHTVIDLNSCIQRLNADTNLKITNALFINEAGQILCIGSINNKQVGILLSPKR